MLSSKGICILIMVYKLYDLTDEEITIVEGENDKSQ